MGKAQHSHEQCLQVTTHAKSGYSGIRGLFMKASTKKGCSVFIKYGQALAAQVWKQALHIMKQMVFFLNHSTTAALSPDVFIFKGNESQSKALIIIIISRVVRT